MDAWVVTGVNAALVRYAGLPVRQVVRLGDTLLGLGDTGFFALDGHDDDGAPIDAAVTTGALKFGSDAQKRLGSMYFGYSSDDTVNVDITAFGPAPQTYNYTLPAKAADSPVGGRLVPGKGMWSRYFQFTLRNTGGACFDIDTINVDVAASKGRRI